MRYMLLLLSLILLPASADPGQARGGGGGRGAVVVVPHAVPRANPFALFGTNRTFFVTRGTTLNQGLVPPLTSPTVPALVQTPFPRSTVLVSTGSGAFVTQTVPTGAVFRFSQGRMVAVDGDMVSSVVITPHNRATKSKLIIFG
jgi:hypothetical protein